MRGGQRTDMSLMSFQGKTNAILELGKRLIQAEEEWKDKCAAFRDLQSLLSDFSLQQVKLQTQADAAEVPETFPGSALAVLFSPENVQALTQPFRVTLTDLRSTVVKEACTTLSQLAETLGPLRCKILVRDVFPTLLEARGSSNKVNTAAIHGCIEAIVNATPSRFVLAPVLQLLNTSKNREVRESCIHYTHLALSGWRRSVLDRFKIPLQSVITTSLSDASPKGRQKARECYWKYAALWPDEAKRLKELLDDGVKKHLKRTQEEVSLTNSVQLESELASVHAELKSVTSRLEATSAQAGDQVSALASEKATLEQRLSSQGVQLAELRTQQSAAVAALEEEKSALANKVSALESGQSEASAQCSEKDDRVAQLESELASVHAELKSVTSRLEATSAQAGDQLESELASVHAELKSVTSRLEATSAQAGDQVSALASEKATLEQRLSSQGVQLAELRTQQSAAVAALEEEKSALANKVSALESGQSEASAQCSEKDDRVAQMKDKAKVNSESSIHRVIPERGFSLSFSRDRAEIVDEERKINEANLLKRRQRRQQRQREA
ncbi:hypothetical protein PHYBOEH_001970 [Phytophthora boehmeriae]|uniref:TOG domain-containing protein n=1 Tax=Phytophthora boehmeriae TaxID=109152 RepID=A0A8T1WRX5_9STRA|nr:hypothetical protein PHYBOEH_001970 [Phytophthora boehmeriae]